MPSLAGIGSAENRQCGHFPRRVRRLTALLAVNQDTLGKQAVRVAQKGTSEVWIKPLANGDWAVGLFNRGNADATIDLTATEIGGVGGKANLRDLWTRKDAGVLDGTAGTLSFPVPRHGAMLLRLTAAK